jgi:TRAP-type transport system small permease protein
VHTLRAVNRVALGVCIIVMCLAVALGVVSRYVVGRPLLWTDEVARLALVWLTFIGAAQLFTYQGGHLSLTLLTDRLGPTARRWLGVVANALELILMLVVAVGAGLSIYYNSEAVTSALAIPHYVVYGVLIFASLVSALFVWRKLFAYARGREPELVAAPVEQ